MKSVTAWLLAGLVALCGVAASYAQAEDAPAAVADPAKPAGEATAPKPEVPTDQALTQGLKDSKPAEPKPEAKDAEMPKKMPTPYEMKLVKIEADKAKAKEAQAKIPALEAKVNEAIGKLTTSDKKPVQPLELQKELAEHRPSSAANQYRDYQLSVAAAYEKVKGKILVAIKDSVSLSKMTTNDEALKTRAADLQEDLKVQCIEVLTKLVTIYERIGDSDRVEATYRQILALDNTNGAAVAFFKELEAKKKNPVKSTGSGGGQYGGTGNNTGSYR